MRNAEIASSIEGMTALERIALVERILESLDATDPAIDVLWADEATDRLDAWRNGRLEAVSISEIFPGI